MGELLFIYQKEKQKYSNNFAGVVIKILIGYLL